MIVDNEGGYVLTTPDGVPYDQTVSAFIDGRYTDAATGQVHGDMLEVAVIPLAQLPELCTHVDAMCHVCEDSWATDYVFMELT